MSCTGETSTITVLFTDIVGSTTLLDRVGADRADQLRRSHFAALREAVSTHGGREVKTTGDGLMVVFTSAVAGIDAAVAMQQGLERLRRRGEEGTAVRIGIAAGEATSEGEDWYGPPVVEAARLCAAADGREVLATGLMSLLAGGRRPMTGLGTRELKGFAAGVEVFRVEWEPPADVMPLPPAAGLVDDGFLVGRRVELDRLLERWAATAGGQRGAVLVSGEPGIGKTRLAAELARRAHAEGATVLWGRCDEELGTGYQPFREALGQALEHLDDSGLADAELARLVPEIAPRLPERPPVAEGDPEAARLRLFEAVVRVLDRVADSGPLLLVLDDLHWAGQPTLLLLRHLLRALTPCPLLVVGTYRDTDLDRTHPLSAVLADLRRMQNVERLGLDGLDEKGVAEFVERAAGHDLDERALDLARAVHEETEGNPFFIVQILRHLVETGAIYQDDGVWTSARGIEELGIPEGVREVVGRRLSRLSELANRALAVGAAIGRDFDIGIVERVLDAGDGDAVLEAVEEAAEAHLVTEDRAAPGCFTFSHALVRQTLLAELSAARRARLHRRIGEAFEAEPGLPPAMLAQLAHHFGEGAAAGTAAKGVAYSELAAAAAADQLAFEEAFAHLERAAQLLELDDPVDRLARARVRAALANALTYSGNPQGGKDMALLAAADARSTGSTELLARAAVMRAEFGLAGIPDEHARALLDEALEAVGDSDPPLRAVLLAIKAFYLAINEGRGSAVDGLAAEAVDIARTVDDPRLLATTLTQRCFVLQGTPDLGTHDVVLGELEQVVSRLGGTGAAALETAGLWRHRAVVCLQRGDTSGFLRDIELLDELGRRAFSWLPQALVAMWRGLYALMEGRFEEVEGHAAHMLSFVPGEEPNFANTYAVQMLWLQYELGNLAVIRPLVAAAVEQTPGLVSLQAALAMVDAELGDLDSARAIVGRLAPDRFAAVPRDVSWGAALTQLAVAVAAIGDRAAAEVLVDELRPYSGQLIVVAWGVFVAGAADRYLAMLELLLGHHDEAVAHAQAALALEERAGATACAARTRALLSSFWRN